MVTIVVMMMTKIKTLTRAAIPMLTLPLTLMLMLALAPAATNSSALAATASATATAADQTPSQPAAQSTPPRAAQDEFVPVTDLPESEKLPAAPFLIAAYSIVWLVLLAYVWSLWRRLTQVERELRHAVQTAARD